MKLLKFVRFENLLLLAISLLIFRYGFLEQHPDLLLALYDWQYLLYILSAVLIAAGGIIIERISNHDRESVDISEDQGYNLFIVFNVVALGIGAYLSYHIGNLEFIAGFVIGSALLYIAATNLRTTILIPNIMIALSAALSLVMIGILNFYPFMQMEGHELLITIFKILLDYSYLIFVIVLMLTLVIDLKNTDADYNSGKNTLPIALGRDRAAKILLCMTIIPAAMLLYYANTYIIDLIYALGYGLLFIFGPLLYFAIKLWSAKTPKDFSHLALVLKLLLLFTSISIVIITLNIQNNA